MSEYRPSGARKGTWHTPAERRADIARADRIYRDKLYKLWGSYHCPEKGCGSPLMDLHFGERHVERCSDEFKIGIDVPVATLTCRMGHAQEIVLR